MLGWKKYILLGLLGLGFSSSAQANGVIRITTRLSELPMEIAKTMHTNPEAVHWHSFLRSPALRGEGARLMTDLEALEYFSSGLTVEETAFFLSRLPRPFLEEMGESLGVRMAKKPAAARVLKHEEGFDLIPDLEEIRGRLHAATDDLGRMTVVKAAVGRIEFAMLSRGEEGEQELARILPDDTKAEVEEVLLLLNEQVWQIVVRGRLHEREGFVAEGALSQRDLVRQAKELEVRIASIHFAMARVKELPLEVETVAQVGGSEEIATSTRGAGKNLKFVALSVGYEAMEVPLRVWNLAKHVGLFFRGKTRLEAPLTGRGPLTYLRRLELGDYDFEGKVVLDVGSGASRFADVVNRVYGESGTRAIALDSAAKPMGKLGLTADARFLPLASESMDLVTSAFVLQHLLPTSQLLALEEMIRVTKRGGDIRVAYSESDLARYQEYLADHPAVESVSIRRSRGVLVDHEEVLKIRLAQEEPTVYELAEFYRHWEARGVKVAWRREVLNPDVLRSHLRQWKHGSSDERLLYLQNSLRLLRSGLGVDSDFHEVILSWLEKDEVSSSLVQEVMDLLLIAEDFEHVPSTRRFVSADRFEGLRVRDERLTQAWTALSEVDRQSVMRHWLATKDLQALLLDRAYYLDDWQDTFSPAMEDILAPFREQVAERNRSDRIRAQFEQRM